MLRALRKLRTASQPMMVRQAYRHELRTAATFPLGAALAEGAFTSVIATKYFNASPFLIAVIVASPMFGNIAALMWSELARNRPLVRMVSWLKLGVVSLIATIGLTAFLPREGDNAIGAWTFAGLVIAVRLLSSGIVTLRSAIWRVNYPRQLRGQIVGRVTLIATCVMGVTTLLGSQWLDSAVLRDSAWPLMVYPAGAALALIGVWQFSQIRVRGEKHKLRQAAILMARPENLSQTDESNVLNYSPGQRRGVRAVVTDAFGVLKDDKPFAAYQLCQFISGMSFMMMQPVLLLLVNTRFTDPEREYMLATLVVQVLPLTMIVVGLAYWSGQFDRMTIWQFRIKQGRFGVLAMMLLTFGAFVGTTDLGALNLDSARVGLVITAIGVTCMGFMLGGGQLAWNLGHNAFASRDRAADYMAVHVMLTGLRGMMAPFIGAAIYAMGAGPWALALSLSLQIVAQLGFRRFARRYPMEAPTTSTPEAPKGKEKTPGRQTPEGSESLSDNQDEDRSVPGDSHVRTLP